MKRTIHIIFFALLTLAAASAQTRDTTVGNWTGKWDPNDPNCPCYDIQKQAEREYQEMLEAEKKGTEEVSPVSPPSHDVSPNTEIVLSKEQRKQLKKSQKKSRKGKEKQERKKKKKGKVICPEE